MLRILAGLWALEPLTGYLEQGPTTRRMPIPGVANVVATWDREAVKELFTADNDSVGAGEFQMRLLGGLGAESVMVIDGDRHLRMRRLLLPLFHGAPLKAYASMIEAIAREQVERWPEGKEFPILPEMHRIVIEVLIRALLGVRDPERIARLRKLLPKVLEVNAITFIAEARLPRLGRGVFARIQPWVRARHETLLLLREEISARRATPRDSEDALGMLIAARDEAGRSLTDDEILDQLLTLLVAGDQTTSATLAWCFERITRHPSVLMRLTEDARNGQTCYLDAALKETQRLRPAVEFTWRILNEPMNLGGYALPAGTVVMPILRMVQTSDAHYDACDFRPERFIDGRSPPYAWIPFGGGIRRCIGASFAMLEMNIIVSTVLRRYDLQLAGRPERRSRVRIFTTVPARGARITVKRRMAPIPRPVGREPASAA